MTILLFYLANQTFAPSVGTKRRRNSGKDRAVNSTSRNARKKAVLAARQKIDEEFYWKEFLSTYLSVEASKENASSSSQWNKSQSGNMPAKLCLKRRLKRPEKSELNFAKIYISSEIRGAASDFISLNIIFAFFIVIPVIRDASFMSIFLFSQT
jgi:hypothetical protein